MSWEDGWSMMPGLPEDRGVMSAHKDFSHKLSCGCEAWRAELDSGIVCCPLHAAAPALLEALEATFTRYPYLWESDEPFAVTARIAIRAAKGETS